MMRNEHPPTCAVCQKPVDSFVMYRDEWQHQTVYEARCHGQLQTVRLDDATLVAAKSLSLTTAFATPLLTE
jgi:hypothetical protein